MAGDAKKIPKNLVAGALLYQVKHSRVLAEVSLFIDQDLMENLIIVCPVETALGWYMYIPTSSQRFISDGVRWRDVHT